MPKTPKAGSSHNTGSIPFSMDQYQVASQYYHQSNYVQQVGNHQTQHVQSFGHMQHHAQYAPQAQNQTQTGMHFNAGGHAIRP